MTATCYQAVADAADFGTPGARKSGRNPRWPYVPVITLPGGQEAQIKGLAYATRPEAVEAAARHIEAQRTDLANRLAQPRFRALRRQYGLPEELIR